ncbi:MAG: noncanonical pyrimidine nucleotidase, YjjG family [Spirosoma sp.]|nr:noncanonical pyrimidine nucleotidase, YjjG family [Spirosoma sp.]
MKYRHLFFDLDHTLWDFDRNSAESIAELYEAYRLGDTGIASAADFSKHFIAINRQLWADYDRNLVTHGYIRTNRFALVFQSLGVDASAIQADLNAEYLHLLARKPHLLESAREVLNYLKDRYTMHIITNGFAEIQAVKMNSADISHYFTHVVTNGVVDAKKPNPAIFQYALNISQADVAESLMIGDSYEADIMGAKGVGMDTVFYNTAGVVVDDPPTYDIRHWNELIAIL